jgi:hypothetical protein
MCLRVSIFNSMDPPELEIADYELLLRVFRAWNPEIPKPMNETIEQYQARIHEIVRQRELKQDFQKLLKKMRKVIVG